MSMLEDLQHVNESAAALHRTIIHFHIALGALSQAAKQLIEQCTTCEAQLQAVESAAHDARSSVRNAACKDVQQAHCVNVHEETRAVVLGLPQLMQSVRDVRASANTALNSMD
jgi:hypothetical protein